MFNNLQSCGIVGTSIEKQSGNCERLNPPTNTKLQLSEGEYMPPKKLKNQVQDRSQTTLEKWLSPVKAKKSQNGGQNISQSVEKKQQPKTKENKADKQDPEQARSKSKKANKKPKKAEPEKPIEQPMQVEKPDPQQPKAKTPSKRQPKTKKTTETKKPEKMEVEEEKQQNKVFKASDPKYSLLFADQDPLSDTQYIFDKTRPESLIISRKVAQPVQDPQNLKRSDASGKLNETKPKKKKEKSLTKKLEKDKNS